MIGSIRAEIIEAQDRKESSSIKSIRKSTKYKDINRPCICLLCGDSLQMLTHAHAEKHGYKDKYTMAKAGKVKFI